MANYEYVTRGQDDGAIIGTTSSDKLGFYGKTPVARPATPAAAVTTGSTTTVCNEAVAEIQEYLKTLGLIASA